MAEKKTVVFQGYSRRLDVFVSDELETLSRSLVQKLIKDGHVTVNGKKVKPSWPLTEGETVEIELPEAGSKTKLSDLIIHDAKDFFVLIKPAGMLVHPQSPVWEEHPEAVFSAEETLVSVILANPPKGFDLSTPRAGLVHRLDRETSGVMVVAKNPEFQAEMVALFSNREVHKTYHSIACGEVPDDEGIIDVPIGRVAGGKIKASDVGREAVTGYKVLERKNGFTYIELYPKTGRTNQLRVHLSWLGYPVLGDWLYRGATADRLMLHARRIEFKHPFTGKKLKFEAPVPPDFEAAWKRVTETK
ncbi:MAG: RluA family pseudouridine synthase [Elusimicrobia bacterium]|nr:RluA family pseudouridine synthase [Elusimicrobiaceae bacterium]MBP3514202.1 RluA family pseudouridine synthase [Elusimicrobiaceae bacterium]MDD7578061.1 RluA family pseudouridine synthase [Elusimicrobiota bacterium]MDY6038898.1 RluA family pseudouridine synthase [Elusimicrobiaceae bacterium]